MKRFLSILIFLNCGPIFSQAQSDTTGYKLHVSLKPKEAYGVIAVWDWGGKAGDSRQGLGFGLSKQNTNVGEMGIELDIQAIYFEVNKISERNVYEFGYDAWLGIPVYQLGISASYYTDFSAWRGLSLMPHMGFGIYFLFITIGYDIFLVNPNFHFPGRFSGAMRFNGSFLEKKYQQYE